jgi:acyl-CoA thioester hydrolase
MTLQTPDGFRHGYALPVRYADMDTLGHVNNAKYLTYVEQARITYVRDLGLWDGKASPYGIIMARAEVDYRSPVTMDDGEALVFSRTTRIGGKSFEMEHLVMVERGGLPVLAARAVIVGVAFDYQNNATITVPEDWRAKIAAYEGWPNP